MAAHGSSCQTGFGNIRLAVGPVRAPPPLDAALIDPQWIGAAWIAVAAALGPRPGGQAMSRYAWTGGSALRETIGEITARAVDCLAADQRIQLLFHFGSSARADSPEPRDVDLAILTRPALSLRELLVLQGEIQEACGVPIDLVDLNDAPVVLAHEVVEGGRCLFSRSPDEETEFVTRTRMRWWDWLPVREEQWRLAGRRLEERLGSQT